MTTEVETESFDIDDYIDFANYALLKSDTTRVITVVNVPPAFSADGFSLIKVQDGVTCTGGMFYDSATGLFYDDEEFTSIGGVSTEADSETASE